MKKNVSILSIGDELLNGFTIDTNSSWLAKEISKYDFLDVKNNLTVKDNYKEIYSSLDYLLSKNNRFIFITGGLGPTHDDITKNALMNYFDSELICDLKHMKSLEKRYPIISKELIKNQSQILSISNIIPNSKGTAIGMALKHNDTDLFILPGVPSEMKNMYHEHVSKKFIEPFFKKKIKYITILTAGIYETKLYEILRDLIYENKENYRVSFLPSYSGVRIRLMSNNNTPLDGFKNLIIKKIDDYIFGFDDDTLEQVISKDLISNGKKIAIAESCTGGYISKKITDIPNSSNYFIGSVVAYSNSVKEEILKVNAKTLVEKGAVSSEVALQMALGVMKKFKSNIGIATTGISGPSGGSKEKPVGLIYIAIVSKNRQVVKKFNLIPDREKHRRIATQVCLNMLRLFLKK